MEEFSGLEEFPEGVHNICVLSLGVKSQGEKHPASWNTQGSQEPHLY